MIDQLKVKVSDREILGGVPYDSEACPIALGVRRSHKFVSWQVAVGVDEINVFGVGHFSLPDDASNWLRDFDRGLPVGPIEFTAERIP